MWLHDIKCVKFLPLKGTLFKIVELILQSRGVIKDFFFFFFFLKLSYFVEVFALQMSLQSEM